MPVRKCKQCSKPLPPASSGDLCSLCASGLRPAGNRMQISGQTRPAMVVQGDVLSGVMCPCGRSELTIAEIERGRCSVCGTQFSLEEITRLKRQAALRQQPR